MSVLTLPPTVRIVEVGPRDGLQNESATVPSDVKVAFVEALAAAGHRHIEVTSFVRPDLVPQLADADRVFRDVRKRDGVVYTALVPNERGLDRALAAGARSIAVFTAASETFSQRNTGCDVATSLERVRRVARRARDEGLQVRAYVSTAFVCPYEGVIPPAAVTAIVDELRAAGIESISIGDTIGVADPAMVDRLLDRLLDASAARRPDAARPLEGIALHLHDTRHRALANTLVGLQHGVEEYDSSAGGLGGCPFAPGASGNLDTHLLVEMLEAMGIATGIDLAAHDRAAEGMVKRVRTGG